MNDTYVVHTADSKYVFRVYRNDWRTTKEEIAFELDLVIHLKSEGIPVSYPITRKDGEFINRLNAPEGNRFGVLFSFAEGEEKPIDNEKISSLFGQSVAELHMKSEKFTTTEKRFELNLTYLIDNPLKIIKNSMLHRIEDYTFIEEISSKLKASVQELEGNGLDWGICHGDLHGNTNISFKEDFSYTHYDFDLCGYGWRSYDIAEFRLARQIHTKGDNKLLNNLWDAFIQGYTSVRPLSQHDLDAIPVFVGIRQLWLMGLCLHDLHIVGSIDTGDGYINKKLEYFRGFSI
ncbi:phosphotransferase [Cytobacillus sp. IB215665]|uniref:phosphotransferase n=1 Tax=Cytobacillus sp. IB215665 TaxID=3097357 RepID=UPI002A0ADC27|nr:phosphotransferase [Cytobacillus sp. IB215665]MDX8364693.1 phosphotransferase [Cytobacillus sp. IB215665]